MSQHTQQKATRLLAEGRVRPTTRAIVEYEVTGDTAGYRVFIAIADPAFDYCTCPASSVCSHIEAARSWRAGEGPEFGQRCDDCYAKNGEPCRTGCPRLDDPPHVDESYARDSWNYAEGGT